MCVWGGYIRDRLSRGCNQVSGPFGLHSSDLQRLAVAVVSQKFTSYVIAFPSAQKDFCRRKALRGVPPDDSLICFFPLAEQRRAKEDEEGE